MEYYPSLRVNILTEEVKSSEVNILAVAVPAETIKRVAAPRDVAANRISKSVEDEAATRIQAAFRSYLVLIYLFHLQIQLERVGKYLNRVD